MLHENTFIVSFKMIPKSFPQTVFGCLWYNILKTKEYMYTVRFHFRDKECPLYWLNFALTVGKWVGQKVGT